MARNPKIRRVMIRLKICLWFKNYIRITDAASVENKSLHRLMSENYMFELYEAYMGHDDSLFLPLIVSTARSDALASSCWFFFDDRFVSG